jgi:DMSO reductase anchor subunit
MHPAVSVIIFTVLSGAGFGAIFWLGIGVGGDATPLVRFLAAVVAAGISVAGLVSSTFHLGHPERAWRAFSQWRTSWLSREGVLAVATLAAFGATALLDFTGSSAGRWAAGLAAVLAITTVYSTAMIYAQLKTVPLWNRWLTAASFLGFALSSGFTLAAALTGAGTFHGISATAACLFLLCAAWVIKLWWTVDGKRDTLSSRGISTGNATGLGGQGTVRLFEGPHSGENYLTREMVHKIGRKHAGKLRLIAVVTGLLAAGFAAAVVHLSGLSSRWLAVSLILQLAGLFVERWLFFAEAKHTVSLYYE